jgi:hypothetical protein
MFKTLILATVLLPSLAFGQSSISRSFYDRNGSFAGSSVTRGNETSFTDRNGRFNGTALATATARRASMTAKGISPGRSSTRHRADKTNGGKPRDAGLATKSKSVAQSDKSCTRGKATNRG